MTLLVIFFAAMAAGLLVVGFANLLPSQTRVTEAEAGGSADWSHELPRAPGATPPSSEAGTVRNASLDAWYPRVSGAKPEHAAELVSGSRTAGTEVSRRSRSSWGCASRSLRWASRPSSFSRASRQLTFQQILMLAAIGGLFGWMLPYFYVSRKVRKRQDSIRLALPDSLDLMVVCVEAGLALNQAIVRVAEEIDRVSPEMSEELTVVNLEIRAGTPRDEALRNFSERTGVEDVKAFVSMLLQTDRFGTSIADSLRVHCGHSAHQAQAARGRGGGKAHGQDAVSTDSCSYFPLSSSCCWGRPSSCSETSLGEGSGN